MPATQRIPFGIVFCSFVLATLTSSFEISTVAASPWAPQEIASRERRSGPVLTSTLPETSDEEDVFEDLEPGVRLFGKPDASVILGRVLAFKPVEGTDNLVVLCEDGIKLWDAKKKKILKTIKFEKKTSGCLASQVSNDKDMFAFSTWDIQSADPDKQGIVWLVDKELNRKANFLFENEGPEGEIPSMSNSVTAIGFSDDDSQVALGTGKELHWCDVESGEIVRSFQLGGYKRTQNLIVEDDRVLAFGYDAHQVDLKDGTISPLPESLRVFVGEKQSIYHRESDQLIGVKDRDHKVIIYDFVDDAKEEIEFKTGTRIWSITLSDDGSRLAVVSFLQGDESAFQIGVYDTQTQELKHRLLLPGVLPSNLEFTNGSSELTAGIRFDAGLQRIKIDPDVVEQEANLKPSFKFHNILLSGDGLEFIGSRLASGALKLDWASGKTEKFKDYANYFFPAQSGDRFFYTGQSGVNFLTKRSTWGKSKIATIKSYSIRKPLVMPALGYLSGFGEEPDNATYYVFPSSLAVNDANSEVHCVVIDTLDGIRIETFKLANNKLIKKSLFKRPKNPNLNQLPTTAITNDGKRFAVYESKKIRVFDIESKELVFEQKSAKAQALIFSKNRDWLASHSDDGVKILDSESGEIIKDIPEKDALIAYAFKADRLLVCPKKDDRPVRIFNTQSWEVELRHNTDTGDRSAVSISNDGRRAAFALVNCRLELWELEELEK